MKNKKAQAKRKQWEEPRIAKDVLDGMIVEYAERRGWLMRDVPPELHSTVYWILRIGGAEEWREHPPAEVYGSSCNQLGRSVNGYPMFTSLQAMYPADFAIFCEKVEAIREAQKEILSK